MIQPAEPIAVIGLGCRFPGADDAREFWKLISEGYDHSLAFAEGNWGERQFLTNAGVSGYLANLDGFDCSFFGTSPREAMYLDPQQRVLLEVSWQAIEDAGLTRSQLSGTLTGVYAGLWASDFEHCLYDSSPDYDIYRITGAGRFAATGRISYFLDLQGPSITIDTACSSSMVAIHLARRALLAGECNLALAGGVNVLWRPEITSGFQAARMLAPDRRCKFGDESADGFVRTEGAAMVVLKRLSDAQRDGDRIYSLLRGTAINNDGGSGGLMLKPSIEGQQRLLRMALADAGVAAEDLQYIEAHGTGTAAGDPVELTAIGSVLAASGRQRPCWVGSVKTNIGHTEGAAGIAGITKVSLALHHGVLPRSLHNAHPTSAVPWDTLPIRLQQETIPWPAGPVPRLAGVSSFGITGTNAHSVLEEAPAAILPAPAGRAEKLLALSAGSPEALQALVGRYLTPVGEVPRFSDWCFTAAVRRTHFDSRLSIVAASNEEAMDALRAYAAGEAKSGVRTNTASAGQRPKIAFVFPGQGSQWIGMGRQLLASEPEFRDALLACEEAIEAETGWRVTDVLKAPAEEKWLDRIDVVQPLIFAISVALAKWWQARGVLPEAVVGHSMGEVAAAHVAGILSLPDAAAIICRRSRLMRELSGLGAMALIELPMTAVAAALRPGVSIAASNGPTTTIISGDAAAVEAMVKEHEARGVFARRVKVDVSSHSAQVDPLLVRLRECLATVNPMAGRIPIYSTVQGSLLEGTSLDAGYWAENLRQPVLFAPSLRRMIADGFDAFVEMSAHPLLVDAVKSLLQEANARGVAFGSLVRDADEIRSLLDSLGGLYCSGVEIDWTAEYPQGGQVVSLPAYPFQRERVWPDLSVAAAKNGHPLLGPRVDFSSEAGTSVFESEIGAGFPAYLADHKVRDQVVFPAAGFWEMAFAASRQFFGDVPVVLAKLKIHQALVLPPVGRKQVQLTTREEGQGVYRFEVRARDAGEPWVLHATGEMRQGNPAPAGPPDALPWHNAPKEGLDSQDLYRSMYQLGLAYGAAFRSLDRLWEQPDGSLAHIRMDRSESSDLPLHIFHPSLLDATLVPIVKAAVDSTAEEDIWVPVSCEEFQLFAPTAGNELYAQFVAHGDLGDGIFGGDQRLYAPNGDLIAELKGIRFQRLGREPRIGRQCLFEANWTPLALPAPSTAEGLWLLYCGKDEFGPRLAQELTALGGETAEVLIGDCFERLGPNRWQIRPDAEDDHRRLLSELEDRPLRGVVYAWALDVQPLDEAASDPGEAATRFTIAAPTYLLRQLAARRWAAPPRLWLATFANRAVAAETLHPQLAQSPLWGLSGVMTIEHPEFLSSFVCLAEGKADDSVPAFAAAMIAGIDEDQIFVSASGVAVPRFQAWDAPPAVASEFDAYALIPRETGVLESLQLEQIRPHSPSADLVRIHVQAGGVNFKDVLHAMGLVGEARDGQCPPLGLECAGVVVEVGPAVQQWKPGDAVMALVPPSMGGGLRSSVTVPEAFVYPIPSGWTMEQAAAQLVVYLTAWYALQELARISHGDRVLIHSAAGGVGMAAIHIAKLAGARVFATAGSQAKREMLLAMGVEAVYDSHSSGFGQQVREASGGDGVDVVLNSLAGPFLRESLDCLAPYGRFVELGKRDIEENGALRLKPFARNLSFFAADLSGMMDERPDRVGKLISQLLPLFASGALPAIPCQAFSAHRAGEAFQLMAQGAHTGKIVIRFDATPDRIAPTDEISFRPDASYLITGGLGGIGLEVASWLVERGARHLTLVGRRAPTPEAEAVLGRLRAQGVEVQTVQADVGERENVRGMLAKLQENCPPLRGVFHAAAFVDDQLLDNLVMENISQVFSPKAMGAWHLHCETARLPLDYFVMFSSIAAVFPQRGQGTYSAANRFLDSLAAYRRSLGLPGLSLNWGGWKDTGLAKRAAGARSTVLAMARRGMPAMKPALALDAMNHAMRGTSPNLLVTPIDAARTCQFYEGQRIPTLLRHLTNGATAVASPQSGALRLVDELKQAASADARRDLLENMLKEQVSRVLRISSSRVDRMKPFGQMGLDSLMAVEFINRLRSGLSVSLTSTAAFNYPTVARLAVHLAGKMGVLLEEDSPSLVAVPAASSITNVAVEGLSEEEAIQALIGGGAPLQTAESGS